MATISERLTEHLETTPIKDLLVTSVTESNGASRTMLGIQNIIDAQKESEKLEDQSQFYGSVRLF